MLARNAPMPSRADLATTADSAGTRAEQRVSAPLPWSAALVSLATARGSGSLELSG